MGLFYLSSAVSPWREMATLFFHGEGHIEKPRETLQVILNLFPCCSRRDWTDPLSLFGQFCLSRRGLCPSLRKTIEWQFLSMERPDRTHRIDPKSKTPVAVCNKLKLAVIKNVEDFGKSEHCIICNKK